LQTNEVVDRVVASSGSSREETWTSIIKESRAERVLELGVFRGVFAEHILRSCLGITHYYMIDPWRHLDDWNKPANVDQVTFDEIKAEAMTRTQFARERRIICQGKTVDVIDEIGDQTLDVAYIDADHTLHGITIDLIRTFPKIRPGGILGGDDYTTSIWQHQDEFEPTLVCPFAAYFAESQDAPLVILPHNQFAIIKPSSKGPNFRVVDTTGNYGVRTLLPYVRKR
jgi:predicted O-methyltransferase YrrM